MTSVIRLIVFMLVAAVGVPPAMVAEADARPRVGAGRRQKARRARVHAVRRKKEDVGEARSRRARRHRTARRIGRRAASVAPAASAAPAAVPAAASPSVSVIPVPPPTLATAASVDIPESVTAEQHLDAIERRLGAMDAAVARARARMDDLKAAVLQPKVAGEGARGGPGSVSAPSI